MGGGGEGRVGGGGEEGGEGREGGGRGVGEMKEKEKEKK